MLGKRIHKQASLLALMASGLLQRKCSCGNSSGLDGQCEGCREKRLSRKSDSFSQTEPQSVPPIVYDVLRSPGEPLDLETRAFMEPHFGHDFSKVRVHTDAKAAESAQKVNALAYTVGQDIIFGAARHELGTVAGKSLLAHELTHVIQQNDNVLQGNLIINRQDDALEKEATGVSRAIMAQQSAPTVVHNRCQKTSVLQRKPEVISVDIIEKPKSELTVPELIEDNLNTDEAILENYRTAIENFETVVNSAAEKEGIPKGLGEIALEEINKFVINQIIDRSLKKYPIAKDLVKLGKSIIEAAEKERKRAGEASVSSALGKFVVNQRTTLGNMISTLKMERINIKHEELRKYNKMDNTSKMEYREGLVWDNNSLSKMATSSHSSEALFQKLVECWIGGAKVGEKPAHVFIRLDKDWKVVTAHINAPRGQRLAEQLLRISKGKVKLNDLNVPRTVEFKPLTLHVLDASVLTEITARGHMENFSANLSGKNYMQAFIDNISALGLPDTTIMTGD
jgi:hypothetical protein